MRSHRPAEPLFLPVGNGDTHPTAGREILRNRRIVKPGIYRELSPVTRVIVAGEIFQGRIVADIHGLKLIAIAIQHCQQRVFMNIQLSQRVV